MFQSPVGKFTNPGILSSFAFGMVILEIGRVCPANV